MFTGIVQAVTEVVQLSGTRLDVRAPEQVSDWDIGESIAVNGVCLTLVEAGSTLSFDLSEETLSRSSLADLKPGSLVNLERAMRASDRFGGHVVQGHVDGVGEIISVTPQAGSTLFSFRIPDSLSRYVIDKGSVSIDGISLTVVNPIGADFDVAVIPHTLRHTNLSQKKGGDKVNIEVDLLAKYVERLLQKQA